MAEPQDTSLMAQGRDEGLGRKDQNIRSEILQALVPWLRYRESPRGEMWGLPLSGLLRGHPSIWVSFLLHTHLPLEPTHTSPLSSPTPRALRQPHTSHRGGEDWRDPRRSDMGPLIPKPTCSWR